MMLSRFSTLILQLISIPILARALGASGMGEIAYAQSIMQIGAVFIDFGFNATAIRSVKLASNNFDDLSKIFWGILVSKFCIFIPVYIVAGILLFNDFSLSLILAGGLFLFGVVLTPVWLYQGLEVVGVYASLQVIFRIISVALIYFVVKDYSDLFWAAFFIFSADFLIGVGCFVYAVRRLVPGRFIVDMNYIRPQLRSGFDAWIGALMSNLISLSTPFFLKNYGGGYGVVGFYSAADKIVKAFHSIVWPTVQSYHAAICQMVEVKSPNLLKARLKVMFIVVGGAFAFSIFCQFFSSQIIRLMYGDSFELASNYLRIYSFYNIFAAINVCLVYYFYYAYGKTAIVRKLYFVQAVLYFSGLISFLKFDLTLPVVIVIVASEFLFSVCLIGFARRADDERA